MPTILSTKSIYFNDVNLMPRKGVITSRKNVSRELERIIVSPMVSIVGRTFIKEAARLGLSVAIPRFMELDDKLELHRIFKEHQAYQQQLCFLGIGLNESDKHLLQISTLATSIGCFSYLVDMANGYIPQLKDKVSRIFKHTGIINNLMIGNVVNIEGVDDLRCLRSYAKHLFIRIGIGNGTPCSSSDVAGINRGQITELIDCCPSRRINQRQNLYLVSDGGIYKSGFVMKAFGAGADYCLMGGYFRNALEAEANITGSGEYFGCASKTQNQLAGLDRHAEGKEIKIKKEDLRPLEELVDELWGGIASGISYTGYDSVTNFISNGIFEIKQNSLPPKKRY